MNKDLAKADDETATILKKATTKVVNNINEAMIKVAVVKEIVHFHDGLWKKMLTKMKENCMVAKSNKEMKEMLSRYFNGFHYEKNYNAKGEIFATSGPGKIGVFKDTGEITIYKNPVKGKIEKVKTFNPIKGQPFYMKFNEKGDEFYLVGFEVFHKFTRFNDENHKDSEKFEIPELHDYTDFHDEEGYDTNYDVSSDGKYLGAVSDRGKKLIIYYLEERIVVSEIFFTNPNITYSVEELASVTPKDCDFMHGNRVVILFNNGSIKIYRYDSSSADLIHSFSPSRDEYNIVSAKNLFLSADMKYATFRALTEVVKKDHKSPLKDSIRHRINPGGQLKLIRNDLSEHSKAVGIALESSRLEFGNSEKTVLTKYSDSDIIQSIKIFRIDGKKMREVQEIRNEKDEKFVSVFMGDSRSDLFVGVKRQGNVQRDLKNYIWHYKWSETKKKFMIKQIKNLGIFGLRYLQVDEERSELNYVGHRKIRIWKFDEKDPDSVNDFLAKSLEIKKSDFSIYNVSKDLSTLIKLFNVDNHHKLEVYTRDKGSQYKRISKIDLTNFIEVYDNGSVNFKARISPNGKLISLVSANKVRILVKTVEKKFKEYLIKSEVGNISSTDFYDDGGIVLGLVSKKILVYKFIETHNEFKIDQVLKGHSGSVYQLTVSDDSKIIVSCSESEVMIWSLKTKKKGKSLKIGKFEIKKSVSLGSFVPFAHHKSQKEYCLFQTLGVKEKVYTPKITNENRRIILSSTFETMELYKSFDNEKYVIVDKLDIFGGPKNQLSFDGNYFINQTFLEEEPARVMGISDTGLSNVFCFPKFNTNFFYVEGNLEKIVLEEKNKNPAISDYILELNMKPNHELNMDICLFDILNEMFSNPDFFIDKGSIRKLVSYLDLDDRKLTYNEGINFISDGQNFKGINKIRKMYEAHAKLNILFIAITSRVPDIIESVLNTFGYIPFMYEKNFDPIDAALEINDGPSLAVISEYFAHPDNIGQFEAYISKERVFKALDCSSEDFKNFIMRFLISDIPKENNLTESLKEFPLSGRFYVMRTTSNNYTRYLHSRLEAKSFFIKKQDVDPVPIQIKTTKVKFSYSVFHPSCREALTGFTELSEAMLVEDARYLINQIYEKNKYNLAIKTVLNWFSYICFCYDIIQVKDSWTLTMSIFCCNLFLLLYILLTIFAKQKLLTAFKNVDTLLDFYQYTSIPVITYLQKISKLDLAHDNVNMWVNTVIIVGGYRALHGLKFFKEVRYMIAIIMQAIIDMSGFAVVMSASFIFFASVGLNLKRTQGEFQGSELFDEVNFYYRVSNGDWQDPKDYNVTQYLVWITSTIFLNIVMMNILIAVVNHTIEKYEEIKELVDVKEQLRMLTDLADFFSYLRYFPCIRRNDKRNQDFICIISNKSNDDSEVLEAMGRLKQEIDMNRKQDLALILRKFEEVKDQIESIGRQRNNQLDRISEEVTLVDQVDRNSFSRISKGGAYDDADK